MKRNAHAFETPTLLDVEVRQRGMTVPDHQDICHRSFAVAGPTTWNLLSADLCDPMCSDESFRRSLKTFLFANY